MSSNLSQLPFIGRRPNIGYIPLLDLVFGVAAACAALFIWWDFDKLVWRQGIPSTTDNVLGSILIILLLEGARRALGPALAVLGVLFLLYTMVGPYLPEILRHRGAPLDFIMAEILGIPYLDVVRAAILPALISYLALFYVVHLEALKLDLKTIPREELPLFFRTFIRGCHFLIPLGVLIVYLVIMRRSPIASALLAIESLVVIMLVQRPVIVFLKAGAERRAGPQASSFDLTGELGRSFLAGIGEVKQGLIQGARNMVSVGVATATAGIIVGVVTSTGLVGRFIILIDTLSMGNVVLMLVFTAMTSLLLGMGMPTTANYIIMATLTAPVIIQLGSNAGLVFPLIAAHLFVFYFGILADDTPPVGLAAYAGAAIARSDPIKTGIQGFTYDLRTAILPFIFLFNNELLMIEGVTETGKAIWINDPVKIGWTFFSGLIAMFAFASGLQGYLVTRLNLAERILLFAVAASTFKAVFQEAHLPLGSVTIQALGVAVYFGLCAWQKVRRRRPGSHGFGVDGSGANSPS